MIQTWIADVTPLLDRKVYEKYYAGLPQWRKEKADRIRYRERQAQSVGAWSLYQRMQETYGLSGETVYNLSHSGKYVLCSIEDEPRAVDVRLGCDVEMIGEFRPGIAKRFFCPTEEAYILKEITAERRAEAFYRYWVLKESFIKATRQGIQMDLRSFEIRIENGQPKLIRQPEGYPEKYYYREYQCAAGDAKIAICSTDSSFGTMRIADIFEEKVCR